MGGNEVANSPWVVDGANIKFNIDGIVVPNGNATLRQRIIVGQGEGEYISGNNDYGISFVSGNSLRLKIENDGRVQIGTQKPTVNDYKLAVDGRIVCKDLQMTMLNWRDDVFSEKYCLKSIEEVEIYIKKNKHLPAFPSENEIIENGMNVKQIFLAQQATLEEMMLYIIALEKRMKLIENKK